MLSLISLLTLLVSVAGAAAAYFRVFSPILGFYVCLSGVLLLAILLFPALVTLFSRSRDTAWLALLFGLGAASLLGLMGKLAFESPLNDVSTDPLNPPKFIETSFLLQVPGGTDLLDTSFQVDKSYDPSQAALQQKHLPQISFLLAKSTAALAFPVLQKVLKEQYPTWRILRANPESFHVEAEVESGVFRFVDDVAIEVRPAKDPADSEVHFRSRSRYGKSDLGANARRIEDLKLRLGIALREAESVDAPRREALAKEAAAKEAAKKAAEEAAAKSQADAVEAGKKIAAPVVNPETPKKGPPPAQLSPYREKIIEEPKSN